MPPRAGLPALRVVVVTLGLAWGATGLFGAKYLVGTVLPQVKLNTGAVLHDVKVVAVGSTTIVASWTGGRGSILLSELPQELRDGLVPAIPKSTVLPAPFEPDAAGSASAELPTDIKLTNGHVMHRSVVTRWEESAILVSYQGGIVLVRLANIVPEQRAIFEARRDDAIAAQERKSAEQTLADHAAARKELERQAKAAEGVPRPSPLFRTLNTGVVIPEVVLGDGRVLRNLALHGIGPTDIDAVWAGGEGKIPIDQLPPEYRVGFNSPTIQVNNDSSDPSPPEAPNLTSHESQGSKKLPSDIKLTNGFVMHRSVVTHWEDQSVIVSYQGGIVPVHFKNMVPEQRAIFEARKAEALAAQAKMGAAQDSVNQAASRLESAQQANTAVWQEEQDRRAEAVRRGASEGYLVRGMTKEQVRQVYGTPQRGGDTGTYTYYGKGRDQRGIPCERILFFGVDGLLESWVDQRGNDTDWTVQRSNLDDGLNGPPH